MKNKTLVIMAAGMGSRFGGLKQLEPVGPNGELIIDYSIYSASKYGFNKFIFIIRKEIESDFKDVIGNRLSQDFNVIYAYQELDNLPEGIKKPDERTKPWGTGHALYCCKDYINENFAVIAADDFYGDEAFKDLSKALDDDTYAIIGYKLGETLSNNGAVKRGVVISNNGIVKDIIESECQAENDHVKCVPLNKNIRPFNVPKDNSVSMLMNAFTPDILSVVVSSVKETLENNKDDLLTCEVLLPDIMSKEIKSGKTIRDIKTNSTWYGITYKEDLNKLRDYINYLISNDVYPEKLWNNKIR